MTDFQNYINMLNHAGVDFFVTTEQTSYATQISVGVHTEGKVVVCIFATDNFPDGTRNQEFHKVSVYDGYESLSSFIQNQVEI